MPDPTPRKKTETIRDIASMARTYDRLALNTLVAVCRAGEAAPAAARVAAANSILDRGHGKAEQNSQFNAEIQITIRKLFEPNALVDVTPVASMLPSTKPKDE